MASTMKNLLTPEEVADRLRLARSTVYRLIGTGIMPAVRVSPGALRVERSELDEWLHERRTASSAVGPGSSADHASSAVGTDSSVDTPAERDGTSSSREAVEPAQLAGER